MDQEPLSTPSFVRRYRARVEHTWGDHAPSERVRFVVLDSETTGLNPATDRLILAGSMEFGAWHHPL